MNKDLQNIVNKYVGNEFFFLRRYKLKIKIRLLWDTKNSLFLDYLLRFEGECGIERIRQFIVSCLHGENSLYHMCIDQLLYRDEVVEFLERMFNYLESKNYG